MRPNWGVIGSVLLAFASVGLGAPSQAPAPPAAPALLTAQQVTELLDRTVAWYRGLAAEQQLASEPGDVLALADSRVLADQILQQEFDFARAAADLVAPAADQPASDQSARTQVLAQLQGKLDTQLLGVQSQLQPLQTRLRQASGTQRSSLEAQIAALQGELELLQARRDAVHQLYQFMSSGVDGFGGSGLRAQIETLASSVAPAGVVAKSAAPAGTAAAAASASAAASAPGNNLWDLTARLLTLSSKDGRIEQYRRQTLALGQASVALRARLQAALRSDASLGDELAPPTQPVSPEQLASERAQLTALTTQFKQIAAALVPLAKQAILLGQYATDMENWRQGVRREYGETVRNLGIRLGVVVLILVLIVVGGELWRRAVTRYVRDARRRYQFLLLRRFALWFLVAIVLASALASRLDSFVTFAGLITAGIAVAMQSVILSIVGYFFLIGKYGIRAGDRIQIGEVLGDVIDVGLVRMHLMEISRGGLGPTGRVVAFSNSIVFQASGGLFKHLAGVHFAWHEVTVTLAASSDAALVRQRLLAAVDAALGEHKDEIERQSRELERTAFESPGAPLRPSVRLRFLSSTLEAIVRYPVDQNSAGEIDEAVSRELLKALAQEPPLQLPGTDAPELKLNVAPGA
jgi:small-conductance mechanosensitive channel